MEKPSYYGILPANVRYDKRLKPMEKILYSEITALANEHGFCFASNSYFGKLYEVHKSTVGAWINNLIKFGYLKVELIYKENSKEVLERRLYIVDLKSVPLSTPVEKEKKEEKKSVEDIVEEKEEEKAPLHEKTDTLPVKKWVPYQQKDGYPLHEKIDTLSIKKLIPSPQKDGYPPHEKTEDNTTRTNTTSNNTTRDNTTTKLDKVNKIEQKEVNEKSSSSFVLENSKKDSSSLSTGNLERDIEISRIISVLFEFGVKDDTIKNIIKLGVGLERVNLVLKSAKEKDWGEGAIYKALKDNWVLGEKKENIVSDEELESKRKWLGYFAGLDKVTRGEVLEIIKFIPLEILEKNKKKLARTESIFEFKQEIRRLGK